MWFFLHRPQFHHHPVQATDIPVSGAAPAAAAAAAVSARLTVGTAVQGVWGLSAGPAGGVQSTDW